MVEVLISAIKMIPVFLLEPHEINDLSKRLLAQQPVANAPVEHDFINHFMGIENLTHSWNEFGLRKEVVERVNKQLTINNERNQNATAKK